MHPAQRHLPGMHTSEYCGAVMRLSKSCQAARLPDAGRKLQHGGCSNAYNLQLLPCAGFGGFYKGMRAKIVQSILAAALLMAVKEQITTTTAELLSKSVVVTTTPSKATVVQLAELSAAKRGT